MKNIWKIFVRDVKRLRNNVIALSVILGITIVPALYAWFNIAASWDPYENTKDLKVAVASNDEGYEGELLPIMINMGDNVLSALRENTQLDWNFTSSDKAIEGVKSGRYYAAIVIPEDFSRNMMSLFSDNITNPQIKYYSNAKKNAISPKVTDKGASAIQTQVNEVFVQTISDTALTAMQTVAKTGDEDSVNAMAAALISNLENISDDLTAASGTVQAFSAMASSAQQALNTTAEFLKQSQEHSDGNLETIGETKKTFSDVKGVMAGAADGINEALESGSGFYRELSGVLNQAFDSLAQDSDTAASSLEALASRLDPVIEAYKNISSAMENLEEENPDLAPVIGRVVGKLNESLEMQISLRDKMNSAAESVKSTGGEASGAQTELDRLVSESSQSLISVKKEYEDQVKKNLDELSQTLENTSSSVSGLFAQLDTAASGIHDLSGSASSDLNQVKTALDTTGSLLEEGARKLSETASQLREAQKSGDIGKIQSILRGDKESISTFLGAPVDLDTQSLYPVENYGSSMAPFYSTLAIWVGGIVLVAMMKVSVSETSLKGLKKVKNYQTYLGRYLMFLFLGLFQSGLICLGDLYYLKIQCEHPFLFLLAGWFTSVVFVNIIYTLTVSFGDIGKAVCVVLLVMQVAGSGGTFPIEVAPEFFQKVYPLLPFTHSMAAMRECVGGLYGMTYWMEMGKLGIFLAVSLFLGLVLRKPVIRLNEIFTEKLESTHLM